MKCLYAVIIMAVYWVSEAVPLAVTSLLPLVLFPILGVLTAKQVATEYLQVRNRLVRRVDDNVHCVGIYARTTT